MHFTKLYIWGPNPFNNRLLATHIQSLTSMTPSCIAELDPHALGRDSMIFCDCDKTDVLTYCRPLHPAGGDMENSPAIILMNVQPETDLLEAIRTHFICGVFYATDRFELIEKGIRKVLGGEHWLSRDLLIRSLQTVRRELRRERNGVPLPCMLTLREREILGLIVDGKDNQTIADTLFISPNTVKTHVSNIYKKIDATNRVQAILWATDNLGQLSMYPVLKTKEYHHVGQSVGRVD